MGKPLRVLMVEDSEDDAILLLHTLRRGGYEVVYAVVDTPAAMRTALERQDWDVITSDHAMPHFSAPAALALARELRPDLPFIIVSVEMDLNLAVSLMQEGAQDYIQKRELARLTPVIERELRDAEIRREHQQVKDALDISETSYRRLFETAQDGILILDADTGQIQDVNPFLIEMLGYSKEEFLGKKLWEVGAFIDTEASKIAFKELQSKGYVRYEDLPLETSVGQHINVEFISNVYFVKHTKVAQCNIRDITARKQTEAIIHKFNAELERRVKESTAQFTAANKELVAFSYSVSHDLRTPLRSIDGFSQALLEEYGNKLDDTGKTYLERIRKATQHMGRLIDDMLKLSRITQAEFKLEAVDLSKVVRAIAEAQKKENPDRSVDVIIQESIIVQGDPNLMQIVLENLLDNAWKFTGKEAHPRIEFGTTVRDGKTACFIRDNGAGFDMAYVDKLFGAFQRLHKTAEFPGTGIGLATVRRIINRHGGHIWAEGEVGKGATFYFTLLF
jgi:PAS domain S-box-containing protein